MTFKNVVLLNRDELSHLEAASIFCKDIHPLKIKRYKEYCLTDYFVNRIMENLLA